MRISDWSSDVCSSDLGSERLRRRGAAGTAVRSLLYAHWAAGGTAPPSSGNISSEARSRRPSSRRSTAALVASSRSFSSMSRNEGMRSEEHTSELQSLLRILYAVFCLQIKHSHTINKYTHVAHKCID